MLDAHYIIDGLISLVLTVVGFIVTLFNKRLDDHQARLDSLPDTYARRDDVKEGFAQLQATLARIEDRLNKKDDHSA